MAADIVPVRLGLTKGDLYTLWAPRWRAADDEWEAFLGKDDDLFAFETVADLVAYIRCVGDHDLADHPAWNALIEGSAHKCDPAEEHRYDVVGVPETAAEKPSEETVTTLHRALVIVSAIGSVCELPAVTKFFNGNPVLGTLAGGAELFSGRSGRKRWGEIEAVIGRGWDNVLDAIDAIVTTPDVDVAESQKAEAELEEPAPEDEVIEVADDLADAEDTAGEDLEDPEDLEDAALASRAVGLVLGSDEDFWLKVGIDPIRVITRSGTFYTLRCYLDEAPVFLGRNGRISVFGSERALARYLADEHDHDLSDLATYDDIRTAATDGSLAMEIGDENIYVLSGVADDIADGPAAVDRDQLELAVELLRDVGHYAEDKTVEETLQPDEALGRFVAHVLDPDAMPAPAGPYAEAVEQWEELEAFVESRMRQE